MKHLIVTADDFGVFPAINEGIIDAVNAGKVNSVAVLANYKGHVLPNAPYGTKYENSLTNVKWLINNTQANQPEIGCHLTVTSGRPLTGDKMDFACDGDGNFHSYGNFRNFKEPEQLKKLYDELCAQVEELKSVPGCSVKHLTNHHTSLTLFRHHFDEYLKVAKKFGLPIRSADVRPSKRQETYLWILDRKLTSDIPKEEREAMLEFQAKIADEFRKNPFGVKGPDFLDSRHYGPVGLLPATRIAAFWLAKAKRKKLDEFFEEFEKSTEKSVELLLHLAKPGFLTVDRSNHLDYSGVDRNYFDSRALELKAIRDYDLRKWKGVEHKGWSF